MNLIRPGWLFILSLLLVAGGCSTASTFDKSQTMLEPDVYVAALSLDTTGLADWPFDSAMVELRNGGPPISIGGSEAGITMVVFEMPRSTLKLGDLQLARMENGATRVYESAVVGPKMKLEKGSVTYVGSLVVDDISLDEETGSPLALRLRIVDGWESDKAAWKSEFPVFAEHDPAHQVAAGWGRSDEVALRPVKVSNSWNPKSLRYQQYPSNSNLAHKRNLKHR